jgi:hypothetical protein
MVQLIELPHKILLLISTHIYVDDRQIICPPEPIAGCLYKTCKSFSWLSNYLFLQYEEMFGEYDDIIFTRTITGKRLGPGLYFTDVCTGYNFADGKEHSYSSKIANSLHIEHAFPIMPYSNHGFYVIHGEWYEFSEYADTEKEMINKVVPILQERYSEIFEWWKSNKFSTYTTTIAILITNNWLEPAPVKFNPEEEKLQLYSHLPSY